MFKVIAYRTILSTIIGVVFSIPYAIIFGTMGMTGDIGMTADQISRELVLTMVYAVVSMCLVAPGAAIIGFLYGVVDETVTKGKAKKTLIITYALGLAFILAIPLSGKLNGKGYDGLITALLLPIIMSTPTFLWIVLKSKNKNLEGFVESTWERLTTVIAHKKTN